jgi:carboxyl-terminal processing protease
VLSVAKYYSPSGKAVQDTAVTPNILVADGNDDFIAPDEDENADDSAQQEKQQKANQPDDQLNKAIEVLKNEGNKA